MLYNHLPTISSGVFSFAIAIATPCLAQSPEQAGTALGEQESLLKVEDFSPVKGRWSLTAGLSYQSIDRGGYIPSVFYVTDPSGAVVAVPTISQSDDRMDKVSLSFGARYALTNSVNLVGQAAGDMTSVRTTTAPNVSNNNTTAGFDALSLGVDFRFSPTPSRTNFTGFFTVAAFEKANGDYIHGKTFSAGLTMSRVVDPLILSASLNYNHFLPRDTANGEFNPGNVITFTPSIGFAVNPDINISWGMGFSYKVGDELVGQPDQEDDVLSTVNLGLGYRLSRDTLLNVNGRAGVGGNDAVQLSVGLSKRF